MTTVVDEVREAAREALPDGVLIIGEERLHSASGGRHEVRDPSTRRTIGEVPLAGREEIDAAVSAARTAFALWRRFPVDQRRDVMLRLADLVAANESRLRLIAAQECGRPVRSAAGSLGVSHLRYYAGWCDKIEGALVTAYPGDSLDYVVEEPYGVVAALTTWNGPIPNIVFKVAPALATGNCVVLKVPENAPFEGILFGELCLEAGIPPGVVNVVVAGPEGGDYLVGHPGVDKISFTGGPEVAKQISRTAADALTPTVMELGGKSANLIFADADLTRAAGFAAQAGAVINAGQACLLPTRLLIEESVHDQVLETLLATLDGVVIGQPLAEETHMGPVISEAAVDRILAVVDTAQRDGHGTLAYGGQRLGGDLSAGNFIQPTVFTHVDSGSPLVQREVFGPVLAVQAFHDEEEALAIANATTYGLSAYAWTRDLSRAHRLARGLEAGNININGMAPMSPTTPFGGNGYSGHGREGGRWGLAEFLRPKNVWIGL
jgi:aldehyde dehydrogenase (NAD+)